MKMLSKLLMQQVRQCRAFPGTFSQIRVFHVSVRHEEKLATKQIQKCDWNRAVSEAERIVGYPTSFLSLRWLLSDEMANGALHLRKLVGSNHPILKTAKYLLYSGKSTMQALGLIVLLVSKAAGHACPVSTADHDQSAGVLHSQRSLAEVTEMIRISYMVHNSLVNLQRSTEANKNNDILEDLIFGNKIGLLTGDFILGTASVDLSNLRNTEVSELIASCIRDFSENQFLGERDEQNNPLPTKPGTVFPRNSTKTRPLDDNYAEGDMMIPVQIHEVLGSPEKEWELRNILTIGSLLGKSCKAALKLGGHDSEMQKLGYIFGHHISLAWQACLDAEPFQNNDISADTTSLLISAPVLFHLEWDTSLYSEIEKGKKSIDNISYERIYEAVLNGPGLEKTKQLQHKHVTAALQTLAKFPPSDARTALENILLAIDDM